MISRLLRCWQQIRYFFMQGKMMPAKDLNELAVAPVGEPPKGLHGSSLSRRSKIR
jgi:hypothetical protein